MALVRRRNRCSVSDLLALVADVDVKPVIVDADLVVGIPGSDGDLEVRGDEIGRCGVEGINGDVLEEKGRFCWIRSEKPELEG